MLNLDDPRSASVFAAMRQMMFIEAGCKRVTAEHGDRRRLELEIVRPAFAALRWLNTERFDGSRDIGNAIDKFEKQADDLAALQTSPHTSLTSPIVCPACGGELTTPHDAPAHCQTCMQMIAPSYEKLDWVFGIWKI
jgi:hypothetical protein